MWGRLGLWKDVPLFSLQEENGGILVILCFSSFHTSVVIMGIFEALSLLNVSVLYFNSDGTPALQFGVKRWRDMKPSYPKNYLNTIAVPTLKEKSEY